MEININWISHHKDGKRLTVSVKNGTAGFQTYNNWLRLYLELFFPTEESASYMYIQRIRERETFYRAYKRVNIGTWAQNQAKRIIFCLWKNQDRIL